MTSLLHNGCLAAALLLVATGCTKPLPQGAILVTEVPVQDAAPTTAEATSLDERYPSGSRVVAYLPPFTSGDSRNLSSGLAAAGGPVVSSDAKRVLFVGKARAGSPWQIFDADLQGGAPSILTDVPGGAMDPCLLRDGRLVFSSPVPAARPANGATVPPQLHLKSPSRGRITRLTFAPGGATEPIVLRDGRILFASALPPGPATAPRSAWFTINNDGTEVTAFSGQQETSGTVRRARVLDGGLLAYIRSSAPGASVAETVSFARPHNSRTSLTARATSIEPAGGPLALVCAPASESAPGAPESVFTLDRSSKTLKPLLTKSGWRLTEAVALRESEPPMGRASAMNLAKNSGLILCLDANRSSLPARDNLAGPAVRLRVTALSPSGHEETIGEAPIHPDGSVSAEVPIDKALGFETLDAQGRILRRQPPMPWVRAGENRSCVGCHEPHNHSPRNARPLAVDTPPTHLVRPSLQSVATARSLP